MGELADRLRAKMMGSPEELAEADRRFGGAEPSDVGQPSPTVPGSARIGGNEVMGVLMPTAGGIGGALAGGLVGHPAAGAVAGSAGMGALHSRMVGEDPKVGAARGAAGEVVGRVGARVLGPLVGKGVNWLADQIGPHAPRVAAALGRTMRATTIEEGAGAAQELLRAKGQTLTAGQASRATTLDTLENIADKSILGGPIVARTREGAQKAADEYLQNWSAQYLANGDRATRGKVLQDSIENLASAHNVSVGKMFEQVDQVIGGAAVDRRPLQLLAAEIMDKVQLKKTLGQGSMGSILKDILDNPSQTSLTFAQAQQLRSELLATKRAMGGSEDVMKGPAVKWINDLADKLDESIEATGQSLNGPAYALYREARALWRKGHETFNNDFINSIVGQESPEVLFDAAVRAGRPTNIRRLREALINPPRVGGRNNLSASQGRASWLAVQGTAIKDLFGKATDPITGKLSGEQLLRAIDNFGDEAGRELLPGVGFDRLKVLARTKYLTEKTASGSGVGSVAIQLQQPGAIIALGQMAHGAITGNPIGGAMGTGLATTVVLGPAGIAKAFTDPKFVDYFSRGLTTPIGTAQATRVGGQILTRLDQLGLLDKPAVDRGEPDAPQPGLTAEDVIRQRIQAKGAPAQ